MMERWISFWRGLERKRRRENPISLRRVCLLLLRAEPNLVTLYITLLPSPWENVQMYVQPRTLYYASINFPTTSVVFGNHFIVLDGGRRWVVVGYRCRWWHLAWWIFIRSLHSIDLSFLFEDLLLSRFHGFCTHIPDTLFDVVEARGEISYHRLIFILPWLAGPTVSTWCRFSGQTVIKMGSSHRVHS